MRDSEKILGMIFLIIGAVDLIRQDWLGFALLSLAGTGLLINLRRLGLPRGVEIALAGVLFALVVVRFVMLFSR